MMFTIDFLRFIDSYQFFDASLRTLVASLSSLENDLKWMINFHEKLRHKTPFKKGGHFPIYLFR